MGNDVADLLNQDGGGGGGAPSFKFDLIGDGLMGPITSIRVTEQTEYGVTPRVVLLDRDGKPRKQLEITVQTHFRNWAKVTGIPTAEEVLPSGQVVLQDLPPALDTGLRRVFVKNQMLWVLGDAVREAGKGATGPEVGDTFGVKFTKVIAARQGEAKQYEVRFVAASPVAAVFAPPPVAAPPVARAPAPPADPWATPPAAYQDLPPF